MCVCVHVQAYVCACVRARVHACVCVWLYECLFVYLYFIRHGNKHSTTTCNDTWANSITVYPNQTSREGNCYGPLDYFLYYCLTSNSTFDINLSPGHYQFKHQPFCLLQNQTKITITGNIFNATTIECSEPFRIIFIRVQNIVISNVQMVKCGDVVNQIINQIVQEIVAAAYFGNGFRFAVMFYHVKNVAITNFTMLNTLSYGLSVFNAIGEVTLSNVHIKNTTFENDPKCLNYSYHNNDADFSCSGSGMLFFHHDDVEIGNISDANTTLRIDQSTTETFSQSGSSIFLLM